MRRTKHQNIIHAPNQQPSCYHRQCYHLSSAKTFTIQTISSASRIRTFFCFVSHHIIIKKPWKTELSFLPFLSFKWIIFFRERNRIRMFIQIENKGNVFLKTTKIFFLKCLVFYDGLKNNKIRSTKIGRWCCCCFMMVFS